MDQAKRFASLRLVAAGFFLGLRDRLGADAIRSRGIKPFDKRQRQLPRTLEIGIVAILLGELCERHVLGSELLQSLKDFIDLAPEVVDFVQPAVAEMAL